MAEFYVWMVFCIAMGIVFFGSAIAVLRDRYMGKITRWAVGIPLVATGVLLVFLGCAMPVAGQHQSKWKKDCIAQGYTLHPRNDLMCMKGNTIIREY